jgi:hypothetical protein
MLEKASALPGGPLGSRSSSTTNIDAGATIAPAVHNGDMMGKAQYEQALGGGQVYLIYLGSLDAETRSAEIARLQANSIPYTEVTSWAEYDRLISDPPRNAVVVFLTGESVPWDRSAFLDWKSLFLKIGTNVRDYGWLLMNEGGYTFFYAVKPDYTGTKTAEDGYNTMMSVVPGASVSQWGRMRGSVTQTGQSALNLVGGSASSSYSEERATSWRGVTVITSYYTADLGGYLRVSRPVWKGSTLHDGLGHGNGVSGRHDCRCSNAHWKQLELPFRRDCQGFSSTSVRLCLLLMVW